MPYVKSVARITLMEEYSVIYKRVRGAQRKVLTSEDVEYILGAAVFLAHAALENYIHDIFSSLARGIRSVATNGSHLPDELRAHLFLLKLNKARIIGAEVGLHSEHDAFRDVIKSLEGHLGALVDGTRELFSIEGKDIYTAYKYPSKVNLIKVFRRIGIDNFFDRLNQAMKCDSLAILESLGGLRSGLAHTGKMTGVNGVDVSKRISDVENLVAAIDRLLYKHICRKFGQRAWIGNVSNLFD